MEYFLEFERPIKELEAQIKELEDKNHSQGIDFKPEIVALQKKVDLLITEIYSKLSEWERVQLGRHPMRPHAMDVIENCFIDFHELNGDRKYANDRSIVGGMAYLRNFDMDGEKKSSKKSGKKDSNSLYSGPIMVIGIEKGRNTKDKILRNFGMPQPEGYRKALRLMELANRFQMPIITLIDTPGAYPGIGAEERGQSEAIAHNLESMFDFGVPILGLIIGEGGSGGALGLGVANGVYMLEYSVYSVISPESCASILWNDARQAERAAMQLKISAQNALKLQVIDEVIPEPKGGAHRSREHTYRNIHELLARELSRFSTKSSSVLKEERFQKFRSMGNTTIGKEV